MRGLVCFKGVCGYLIKDFFDHQSAVIGDLAVHFLYCFLAFVTARHADETELLSLSRVVVDKYFGTHYRTAGSKKIPQIRIAHGIYKIPDVKLHTVSPFE